MFALRFPWWFFGRTRTSQGIAPAPAGNPPGLFPKFSCAPDQRYPNGDRVTQVSRDQLHWLPISKIMNFKVAVLAYKCLRGLVLSYLGEMCVPVASSSSRSRSEFVATTSPCQAGDRFAVDQVASDISSNCRECFANWYWNIADHYIVQKQTEDFPIENGISDLNITILQSIDNNISSLLILFKFNIALLGNLWYFRTSFLIPDYYLDVTSILQSNYVRLCNSAYFSNVSFGRRVVWCTRNKN